MQRDTGPKMETLCRSQWTQAEREAIDRQEVVHSQEVTTSVPVGGSEEKNFVGVERFALHQKGHVRHVLVVEEVRI